MSPTQRSLTRLRQEGYLAAVVERFNPHARVRQDLFGFADVVAVRAVDPPGVLAVQATTASNLAARRTKVAALATVRVWLAAGNRLELWAWAKRGPRGRRKLWTLTREPVRLADLATLPMDPLTKGAPA